MKVEEGVRQRAQGSKVSTQLFFQVPNQLADLPHKEKPGGQRTCPDTEDFAALKNLREFRD